MTSFIFPTEISKNSNLTPAVCKIFFSLQEDIDAISSIPDRFHRHVDFKSGKTWSEIYFTPGSAEFTEKPKDNDAGELIEQSLKFIFPGEDDTNLADLDAIRARPVLVSIQYSDGESKLMGDLANGAKITQVSQVSSKATGAQIEFYCLTPDRACWITA